MEIDQKIYPAPQHRGPVFGHGPLAGHFELHYGGARDKLFQRNCHDRNSGGLLRICGTARPAGGTADNRDALLITLTQRRENIPAQSRRGAKINPTFITTDIPCSAPLRSKQTAWPGHRIFTDRHAERRKRVLDLAATMRRGRHAAGSPTPLTPSGLSGDGDSR